MSTHLEVDVLVGVAKDGTALRVAGEHVVAADALQHGSRRRASEGASLGHVAVLSAQPDLGASERILDRSQERERGAHRDVDAVRRSRRRLPHLLGERHRLRKQRVHLPVARHQVPTHLHRRAAVRPANAYAVGLVIDEAPRQMGIQPLALLEARACAACTHRTQRSNKIRMHAPALAPTEPYTRSQQPVPVGQLPDGAAGGKRGRVPGRGLRGQKVEHREAVIRQISAKALRSSTAP